MKTNNLIAQKLADIDKKFEFEEYYICKKCGYIEKCNYWCLSEELDTKKYPVNQEIKDFFKSFAKDLLQSVGEELIGKDESEVYANGDLRELAERTERVGRNQLRSDLRIRLKKMEEGI